MIVKQTRFKLAMAAIMLGFIEGLVRIIAPSFPLVELYSFQGAVIGAYVAARTVGNIKEAENDKNGD